MPLFRLTLQNNHPRAQIRHLRLCRVSGDPHHDFNLLAAKPQALEFQRKESNRSRVATMGAADLSSVSEPDEEVDSLRNFVTSERAKVVAMVALAMALCNADRVVMSVAIVPMSASHGWSQSFAGVVQVYPISTELYTFTNSLSPIVLNFDARCGRWVAAVVVSVGVPAVAHSGRGAGGPLRRQGRHGVGSGALVAGHAAHTVGRNAVAAPPPGGPRAHGHRRGRGHAVYEQHDFHVRLLGHPSLYQFSCFHFGSYILTFPATEEGFGVQVVSEDGEVEGGGDDHGGLPSGQRGGAHHLAHAVGHSLRRESAVRGVRAGGVCVAGVLAGGHCQ